MSDITVIFEGNERTDGLVGFISWDRVAEMMYQSREVRTGEHLVQLVATKHGIEYFVERK